MSYLGQMASFYSMTPWVLAYSSISPILFFLKKIIYFNWRLITLQYCDGFCLTYIQDPYAGSYSRYIEFLKEPLYCSPELLYHFTFTPAMKVSSHFPIPSSCLSFVDIFNDDHSESPEVISYCSFNLHFSNT